MRSVGEGAGAGLREPFGRVWPVYAWVVVVLLAAHGLLLLSDGVFWDDWLATSDIAQKVSARLIEGALERGVPTDAVLLGLYARLSHPLLASHIVVLLSLVVATVAVFRLLRDFLRYSVAEALLVALLAGVYPGFQTWVLMTTSQYVFYYALFMLACWVALDAERRQGLPRWNLRLMALVLFFVAFSLNSLLVYYFGFLWLLFWVVRRDSGMSFRELARRETLHRAVYLVLPFAYWALKELVFPRHGLYAGYNRFMFSPEGFGRSVASFLVYGVWVQLDTALRVYVGQPALLLLVGVLASWLHARLAMTSAPPSGNGLSAKAAVIVGVVLLAFAILPYAAVGLHATSRGWATRHSLLLGLPMAFIVVGVVRSVFASGERGLSLPGAVVLTTLAVGYVCTTAVQYLSWEARWAKDRSVIGQLATMRQYRGLSVFLVDDSLPLGGEAGYRFYEWSGMFERAWGGESHIGMDRETFDSTALQAAAPYFNERYLLSNFDPRGCRAVLVIRPRSPQVNEGNLGLRYMEARFLHRDRLPQFLSEVASVSIEPIADSSVGCSGT